MKVALVVCLLVGAAMAGSFRGKGKGGTSSDERPDLPELSEDQKTQLKDLLCQEDLFKEFLDKVRNIIEPVVNPDGTAPTKRQMDENAVKLRFAMKRVFFLRKMLCREEEEDVATRVLNLLQRMAEEGGKGKGKGKGKGNGETEDAKRSGEDSQEVELPAISDEDKAKLAGVLCDQANVNVFEQVSSKLEEIFPDPESAEDGAPAKRGKGRGKGKGPRLPPPAKLMFAVGILHHLVCEAQPNAPEKRSMDEMEKPEITEEQKAQAKEALCAVGFKAMLSNLRDTIKANFPGAQEEIADEDVEKRGGS